MQVEVFASMTQGHSPSFAINQLKAVIYFKLEAWRLHFERPQYVNKRSVLPVLPPPLFICMRSLHSISILCHIRKQLHRGLLYPVKKITLFETGWEKKYINKKCSLACIPPSVAPSDRLVSTGVNIYFTLQASSSEPLRTYLTRSEVYNSWDALRIFIWATTAGSRATHSGRMEMNKSSLCQFAK